MACIERSSISARLNSLGAPRSCSPLNYVEGDGLAIGSQTVVSEGSDANGYLVLNLSGGGSITLNGIYDTGSGRWTRIEDSWVVEQRVGWCAMRRGGEPWRGLL